MLPVIEVIDWLESLSLDSSVGISEGGLTLYEVTKEGVKTDSYLELGGIPEEIE